MDYEVKLSGEYIEITCRVTKDITRTVMFSPKYIMNMYEAAKELTLDRFDAFINYCILHGHTLRAHRYFGSEAMRLAGLIAQLHNTVNRNTCKCTFPGLDADKPKVCPTCGKPHR